MTTATLVRFLEDDPFALWVAGDLADDLGWEDGRGGHITGIRLFRLHRTKELLSLTEPFARGLVEDVEP